MSLRQFTDKGPHGMTSPLMPGSEVEYYFVFDAINTVDATQDFHLGLLGKPDMGNYDFNLTFWGIDFNNSNTVKNVPISTNPTIILQEEFGTDRKLSPPIGNNMLEASFMENDFQVKVSLEIANNEFTKFTFKRTDVSNNSISLVDTAPLPPELVQRTPEPTSILGLLALGSLGFTFKRKRFQ